MMTRQNIEESIKEARRFIVTAQAAIERLNGEKSGRNDWYETLRMITATAHPKPEPCAVTPWTSLARSLN